MAINPRNELRIIEPKCKICGILYAAEDKEGMCLPCYNYLLQPGHTQEGLYKLLAKILLGTATDEDFI
jgi:hypothetical protein